jgi:tetratricopeptide (TPR) repeat protein
MAERSNSQSNISKPHWGAEAVPGIPYKRGELIGQWYEVCGILGSGGFGIVYLVYVQETGGVYAMKTFREEFLQEKHTRENFQQEANVWVNFNQHPNIVEAKFLDTANDRLYIGMEFITPNSMGINSLEDYIRRVPFDLARSLSWAIQICDGMSYAFSKGLKAHRDIKPANIMIANDLTAKVTDFGLANVVASTGRAGLGIQLNMHAGSVGLSFQSEEGKSCGTPTHMAPEQFFNAAKCNERSDLYSFGIVLYQMVSGGKLPFIAPYPKDNSEKEMMNFWREMARLHNSAAVPVVDSPLMPIIKRCLAKNPPDRYKSFAEVRRELEVIYYRQTGKRIEQPKISQNQKADRNQAMILMGLKKYEEALACLDQVIAQDPRDYWAWVDKSSILDGFKRFEESLQCMETALRLEPNKPTIWIGKGNTLMNLERYPEALACYEKSVELDRNNAGGWTGKGSSLVGLRRFEEAIACYERAVQLDKRSILARNGKCFCLNQFGRSQEALDCIRAAVELSPWDPFVWRNQGDSYFGIKQFNEALKSYEKALEINPQFDFAWYQKGMCLFYLQRYQEAVPCFSKAIEINPNDLRSWSSKGCGLFSLGQYNEAWQCFKQAVELSPQYDLGWYIKGLAEDNLGRGSDAAASYRQFMQLVQPENQGYCDFVSKRLAELG